MEMQKAQEAVLARGMRFDAAQDVAKRDAPPRFIARASSEDIRTGKRTHFTGEGATPEAAYGALVAALPDRGDGSQPVCATCGQPLPVPNGGRYDAP